MTSTKYLSRRVLFALGALLLFGPAMSRAQDFPARPVVLVVPWPAGGTTDVGMRALASATEKYLNQKIVIENRPGAAGVLGPQQVAQNAAPDGYTLVQIPITVFRYPFMRKTTLDPEKDFTYVIGVTGYTFGVVVRNDAPWKTFQEFLAYAKANPGKINYGTPGAGTTLHITMEQIAKQQGIKWTHVPFKGTPETTGALLGGHIDAVADASGWAPLVKSGQLRLLVIWNAARSKNFPDVPTLRETGVNLVSNSPFGLAGPKGMDPKTVQILHDAFKKGAEDPSYIASMEKLDQEAAYMSSDAYRRYATETLAEQKKLIEELGLKQD
ncbi:MAG: tripartite tricarboxylate transporter substrate binding protein [Rhizobiales bacterium]|nr:tripartite tricarboxylate transporter substrate binding protein [Hyphomicrobiales bacterium]